MTTRSQATTLERVHPQQRNAPAKVRFFIEHFEQVYAAPGYWVM